MELKACGDADSKEWDANVSEAEYATIFHTWGWLSTIQKHGRGKLHAIMGLGQDSAVALLPMFVQKRMGMTLLFSPPPQTATPYLGPLFRVGEGMVQSVREDVYNGFQKSIKEYIAEEIKPDYAFILTPPGLVDVRPWQWDGYAASPLYEYTLDPSIGEAALWGNLKRNLRYEITQTQKANVKVRFGGRSDYIGLIKDTKERYRQQNIVEETEDDYITELFDRFYPDHLRVLVAEHEGERVAGIVELIYGGVVSSWLGGVKSTATGIFPNSLVHWESIRQAAEAGVKQYVEIGANTRHLCSFKRQFDHSTLQYFSLRKYTNSLMRVVETGYTRVYKPIRSCIKLRGGKYGG